MADERPGPGDPSASRIQRALLLAIVVAATLLRFGGLHHDLRRTGAEFDEDHNFVDPIRRMWNKGTPDPVVYAGYAGLFNHLAFAPVLAGQALGGDAGAVVGGRALVAAFGVLNVVLVHRLCRRSFGPGPALGAAALLAVSRAEVRAAHYITPDVLVVSALLGMLLVFSREAVRPGDPVRVGVLSGLASAVKYTGLLIAPAALVGLMFSPRRGHSLVVAVASGLAAFAVGAPYAIVALGRPGMGAGLSEVVGVYFGVADGLGGNEAAQGRGLALGDVLGELFASVGPGAVLLAALAPLFPRHRGLVAAASAVAAVNVVVLAAANLIYSRHVLVLAAAVVVLAAAGAAALLERWPSVGRSPAVTTVLTLAILGPPASLSVPLTISYARPGPADGVAEWIERESTTGALVATSYPRLDLDPDRFEVRTFPAWTRIPPAVLPHYDLLVLRSTAERAELQSAVAVTSFQSARWEASVVRIPRPPLARIEGPRIEASPPGAAGAAFDGDRSTAWRAPSGPGWVEARWPEPREVHRIEVEVLAPERSWPQTVTFEGRTGDDETWIPLPVFGVRPNHPTRQRTAGTHGQVFVLTTPTTLRGLRLLRLEGGAWDLAELKILVRTGTGQSSGAAE